MKAPTAGPTTGCRLPLNGFDTIHDLQVSENGNSYYNKNTEEPGTFMVRRSDDSIRLQWFYDADDEERTFTISYRLDCWPLRRDDCLIQHPPKDLRG